MAWEDALQGNTKSNDKIRLHVVVRLAAASAGYSGWVEQCRLCTAGAAINFSRRTVAQKGIAGVVHVAWRIRVAERAERVGVLGHFREVQGVRCFSTYLPLGKPGPDMCGSAAL